MTKKVRLWKLGNSEHSILPTPRAIEALKNILEEVYSQDFKPLTLIMCHPGSGRTQEKGEHPSESREIEANFLRKLTS